MRRACGPADSSKCSRATNVIDIYTASRCRS